MKKIAIVTLIMLAAACKKNGVTIGPDLMLAKFKTYTLQQMDTMKTTSISLAGYSKITDYAADLLIDTNSEIKLRGDIILSILSNQICLDLKSKILYRYDDSTAALINRYASFKYYLCPEKESNFLKLAQHAGAGDYGYIYSRFKVTWYFIPCICIAVISLLFSIVNLIGLIKWKHRRKYNITFITLIVLVSLAAIIFKSTCSKYVTQNSFYGIHF